MKTAGRLLAILLAALMLAATFGCSLIPTNAGEGGEKSTKAMTTAATTVPVTEAAKEDDLLRVRALYHDLFASLTKAETAIVYDDPTVGTKLRASSTLTKEGETFTYQAKVDRVNPADAERFVTEETLDPVVGTVDEIRANYSGIILWDRVATGLVLSVPEIAQGYVASPVLQPGDGETTLTATVPDDQLENFFGFAPTGVSGMKIAVVYTETAVLSLELTYVFTYESGSADVTVNIGYTY